MNQMSRDTRILIVDDDLSLRRTTALILKRRGYAVETAEDGAQAVEQVSKRPFDIVLMDIRMPVMDGVEALKQIKVIRPHTVIVMMTAYAVEDLIQDALDHGAFAVLYKPVDIGQIIALIERAQQGAFILVVDKDGLMRDTLQSTLHKKGYRVCTVSSGEEAIAQAREAAYDILLVDLDLPALNGLETYLAIKAMHPHVVAIVFAAQREDAAGLAEQAINNSAYACLYKPLDMDRLLELIAEITTQTR